MGKEKIYIVQMHTKTIPARLVKSVTHYPYSHVGICLTNKCDEVYSFGRKSLYNVLNGGFVKEYKNGAFFNKFDDTVCRVYELEIDENQYLNIKEQLDLMEETSDLYKYDFLGAFLRAFHIPAYFKNKYVCSTFVADVLEQAGVCSFEKELCFVKPIDFENISGAKEVFLGEYKKFEAV